jgi:hypothetical protein
LYVTGELLFNFNVVAEKVMKMEDPTLRSNHEEADTRMLANCPTLESPATVVLRTTDSDVHKLKDGIQLKLNCTWKQELSPIIL